MSGEPNGWIFFQSLTARVIAALSHQIKQITKLLFTTYPPRRVSVETHELKVFNFTCKDQPLRGDHSHSRQTQFFCECGENHFRHGKNVAERWIGGNVRLSILAKCLRMQLIEQIKVWGLIWYENYENPSRSCGRKSIESFDRQNEFALAVLLLARNLIGRHFNSHELNHSICRRRAHSSPPKTQISMQHQKCILSQCRICAGHGKCSIFRVFVDFHRFPTSWRHLARLSSSTRHK